jgi:hypothetical protein
MIDEKTQHTDSHSFFAELEDWERLVKVSDRKAIVDLVKLDKHLLQHEFRGFRPDHLLWGRVPALIARHAEGCDLTRNFLIGSWRAANKDLCLRVKEEVSIIAIEDDVAKLLAHIGSTEKNRDCLLWALILDDREEIKKALAEGLHEALLQESSYLWVKVEVYTLRAKLEDSEQVIKGLQSERDGLKEQVAQIPKIVSTIQDLQRKIKQVETQHKMDLARYDDALQAVQREREQVAGELEHVRREKDEAQSLLEDERKKRVSAEQSESTLQSIRRAERERDLAYEKRDEERSLRQEREAEIERLERGKEGVIAQVRKKDGELKQVLGEKQRLEKELSRVQSELDAIYHRLNGQDLQIVLPFVKIDQAWSEAVEQVAHHVSLALSQVEAIRQPVGTNERWVDWQNWQQMEERLIGPLLSSLSIWARVGDVQDMVRIESAQKLLLLRWYLLEWYKSLILDLLQVANRAVR